MNARVSRRAQTASRHTAALLAALLALTACSGGSSSWVQQRTEDLDDVINQSDFTANEADFIRAAYLDLAEHNDRNDTRGQLTPPAAYPLHDLVGLGDDICRRNRLTLETPEDLYDRYRELPLLDRNFISIAHTHLCPDLPDPTQKPDPADSEAAASGTEASEEDAATSAEPTTAPEPTATPAPPPFPATWTGDITDPAITWTDKDHLIGSYQVHARVTRYAEPDTIADNLAGAPRPPADGHRLVALTVEVEPQYARAERDYAGNLNLTVDNRRINYNLAPGTNTFAISIPETATPIIQLETPNGQQTVTQQLDPATGNTSGEAPAIWLRTLTDRTATINETYDLPFTARNGELTFHRTLTLNAAYLVHATDTIPAPADTQTAILVLDGTSTSDEFAARTWRGQLTRPEQATLTLPDGTTLQATYATPNNNDRLLASTPYWEVPADLTQATLTIAPGSVPDRRVGNLEYGTTTITTQLNFG